MLTAKFVEGVRTAGVYRDKGNPGLLLRVGPGDSKRWVLRTTFNGSRRDIGLGSARDITLSDAREEAATLRRAARAGRDPTAERRSVKHVRLTFAEAAEKVHAARKDQWRNGKHVEQWITTLRTYAFPLIGRTPVGQIQAADVLRVLTPIWLTKPETARRVRQRIGVVLDWAATAGHRSNLAVNAAHAVRAGLPKQPRRNTHHAAIPWTLQATLKTIMRTGIVKQLEHSCALTLDSEARDALVGLLVFLVLQGDSSSPDGSTLRRRTKLARKAERLTSEIEADLDFSDFSFRNPVTDLPERLRFFAQLRTPGRRRGRPSRDYNNFAIDKLAVFFHQVGGEVAVGGGPFTKFLKIVWEVLPPDKRCASANTFARRAKDRLPLLRGQLAENLSSIDPIDCSVSRGSTPI